MPRVIYPDGDVYESSVLNGVSFLREAARRKTTELQDCIIQELKLENCGFYHHFKNVSFERCVFLNAYMDLCDFTNVRINSSTIEGASDWLSKVSSSGTKKYTVTNEEIAKRVGGKVYSLPNKDFVKVSCECDFCHNKFEKILRRTTANSWMKKVPNCEKRVCDDCYSQYKLAEKEYGHRHYGYAGRLNYYRTPMDKANTAILGLEMEFEGDFYGWKELQDAHKGQLHYGYDSSVRGQNELSWDCGSYSWWKYLSTLKPVCEVLKKYGGSEGDTAGIHIHVSRGDVNMIDTTDKINRMCREGVFNILMRAVSLRNDKSRFDRYANLEYGIEAHHAGISYNSHGTCEFRVFNSSLDHKLILKHLMFCKTLFNAVADGKNEMDILPKMSKSIKKYIVECAEIQANKGFITDGERDELIKSLKI